MTGSDAPVGDLGPPRGELTVLGWPGGFGTYLGIVLITVAALPCAALAVWALAEVGIVYGTVPWVAGWIDCHRIGSVRVVTGQGVVHRRWPAQHRRRRAGRTPVPPLVENSPGHEPEVIPGRRPDHG